MKSMVKAVALLLATGSLSSCTQDQEPREEAGVSKQTLTYPPITDDVLFIARAKAGKLQLDENGAGELRLDNVPTMTWFSDRPSHDAGVTDSVTVFQEFGWTKNGDELGAGDEAPNAALVADNIPDAIVLEIMSVTDEEDTLTFEVKALSKAEDATGVELANPAFFIDSVQPLAEGTVVGTVNAGLPVDPYKAGSGRMVVTGNVVLTPEGKQAVNLTVRPFWNQWNRYGYDSEKHLITLTEGSPFSSPTPLPFVSVSYSEIRFLPADPAAGRPTALLRVIKSSGAGFEEIKTTYTKTS